MDRTNHISRKLIAVTPLLLICGIIAQTVLLIMALILYVPALLFPALLNGFYRTITKAMARLFAQSIFGRKPRRESQAEMVAGELPFRDLGHAGRGASRSACPSVTMAVGHNSGGTK